MKTLEQLTRNYLEAFNARNLLSLGGMFSEDFTLQDPSGRFVGKSTVLDYLRGLLEGAGSLSLTEIHIFVDDRKSVSVLEFGLVLGEKSLVGTDVIHWQNGLMKELRAYLY